MQEFVYRGHAVSSEEFFELKDAETRERLLDTSDIDYYRGSHGKAFAHAGKGGGYTVAPVLEFLWGLPCNNLILAYIAGLNPSSIRVVAYDGYETTDAQPNRVTVYLDQKNCVESIKQEISVLYSYGSLIDGQLRAQKKLQKESDNASR